MLELSKSGCRDKFSVFIGALYSKKFIDLSLGNSYVYSITLNRLLVETKKFIPELFNPNFNVSIVKPTAEVKKYVSNFEQLELNEEMVWLWRAWRSTNRNGKNTYFQLYPLYKRLGRQFTQAYYELCDNYFSARKAEKIDCVTLLSQFVKTYPAETTPKNISDPQFIGLFWRQFFAYFMQTGHASGNQVSTLIAQWRRFSSGFIEAYLIESGLFARPWGELPSPDPRKISGANTHI